MNVCMMLCVCILVCLCACICPHIWWCRFGVDDGFGIMVVSGCRLYVTEPVDVVFVVTGHVLYVVVGRCMYVRCCGGGCAGNMIYVTVDVSG